MRLARERGRRRNSPDAALAEGSAVEFGASPPADSYGEPPMDWHMRFYA